MNFVLTLNLYETFGLSVLVLLLGQFLVKRIGVLQRFLIPAPVVGGIIYALLVLVGNVTGSFAIELDMGLKSFFMICFFTTIGFNASIDVLKKGGVGVVIFLAVATVLAILQNLLGSGIAMAMGENPLLGLAAGSIPMTGGHGTSAAFGPSLEAAGLTGGTTIAVAAATFGLVAGSLTGGPVASRLIRKYNLKSSEVQEELSVEDITGESGIRELSTTRFSNGFFQLAIAVGIGSVISKLIQNTGLVVPAYIGSMLVAAAMANIFTKGGEGIGQIQLPEIQAVGDVFLSVFLAQALMELKLWELADLALPLITILAVQAIVMFLFASFVTFPAMGKDYDAAVISAGHCGFGLGATPNGVANMTQVVRTYGPSTKAFFILPIVGGLFIDLTNALNITFFINLFSK